MPLLYTEGFLFSLRLVTLFEVFVNVLCVMLIYSSYTVDTQRTEGMVSKLRAFPKSTVSLLNRETRKKTGSFTSVAQMQSFQELLETDRDTSDVLNLVTGIALYMKYHTEQQACQSQIL